MPQPDPRVAVMILNWNGLRWLTGCLSSVAKTEYANLEVYLIDNGSTDTSVQYVRRNFPQVKVIENDRNMGFAKAYNSSIAEVHADYVVLLNTDVKILNPGWIHEVLATMKRDANAVAVACKMVSMEDDLILDSVGGMGIPFWRGFVDIGRGMVDVGQFDDELFEPFAFCGGAALINRDAFLRAGGFDSEFFLYVEDPDLSWRFRLLGHSISYAPKAKVAHYFSGSAESKGVTPTKLYHCQRNFLRSILKNCGKRTLPWAVCNYLLFNLLAMLGFGLFEPEKASAIMRALIWNLRNLPDTYAWRRRIQGSRKIDDADIIQSMYPPIERYQPAEHIELRRILNILFERSQRKKLSLTIDR